MEHLTFLNVLVVGAGPAGLTAAISLRQAGHKVTILERSPSLSAFGAALVLSANAAKVLEDLDTDFTEMKATQAKFHRVFKGDTLEQVVEMPMNDLGRQYFATRIDLASTMTNKATGTDFNLLGPPVTIVYDSKISAYDAEAGTVQLENGTIHTFDLVVAADGVHSPAVRAVVGQDCPAEATGTTIIRFMLPISDLASDPATAFLVANSGQFSHYVGPTGKRYLVVYPARDDTLLNCGLYEIIKSYPVLAPRDSTPTATNAPEPAKTTAYSSQRVDIDQSSLREALEGFHPSFLNLVPKTASMLSLWPVAERKPLPTWHKGRLLLIGDAAHPMLPNLGQGASMAIEDAGALGILFTQIPSFNRDDMQQATRDINDLQQRTDHGALLREEIERRLRLFEEMRHPRASCVQLLSSVPSFTDATVVMRPEISKYVAEEEIPTRQNMRTWLMGYDVVGHARRVLEGYLGERQKG